MKITLNLIFLFMLACSNFSNSQVETNIYVNPIIGTGVFEDYFYTEKFIPLETNEKCLIGTLSLIRETKSKDIVVISNWHQSSVEVLLFSKNGEFLTKIGKKGQGPGEYSTIRAVHIDEKDNAYILDDTKVHVYDSLGIFVKDVLIKDYYSGIFVTHGDMYLTMSYHRNKQNFFTLQKLNERGEVCDKYIESDILVKYKIHYSPRYSYDMNNDNLSLLEFYRQKIKIFSISSSRVTSYTFEEDSCGNNKYVRDFMRNNLMHVVPRKKHEKVFRKLHRFDSAFYLVMILHFC